VQDGRHQSAQSLDALELRGRLLSFVTLGAERGVEDAGVTGSASAIVSTELAVLAAMWSTSMIILRRINPRTSDAPSGVRPRALQSAANPVVGGVPVPSKNPRSPMRKDGCSVLKR
jgi:hypothetical protein